MSGAGVAGVGGERAAASGLRLTAIVPTWNEAPRVGSVVRSLADEVDRVFVADAGSPDGTADEAHKAGARVVKGVRKGRGSQLRAGVQASREEGLEDALVFVHADTGVPDGFGRAIRSALSRPEVVGGNFRLRFEPRCAGAALFGAANDLRRRWLAVYYGDSCIFARRRVYDRLGGFADAPLMEDYAFARALERAGPTAYITAPQVTSSARRFAGRPLRTLGVWALIQGAYSLGVSPARLQRLYADLR